MRYVMRAGLIALFVIFSLSQSQAWSQGQIGGGLDGTVRDASGAVIPQGTVRLVSEATDAVRVDKIDHVGYYSLNDVPPGKYTLIVEVPGFEASKMTGIEVTLNQTRSLDVSMTVGKVSDTVDVAATGASVTTEQVATGSLIDSQQIKELPLNGRDYQQLTFLAPGTARTSGASGQGSGITSAGARSTVNNYLIDGGDANDPTVPSGTAGNVSNSVSAIPLDALGEFTVITSNAPAEFGRSSGAVINVVSKSGANTPHFTVWEFIRNSAVNTRGFYDPVGTKTPFKQNEFGAWVAGKIIRDKTFFSGAYEGFRQVSQNSSSVVIPTSQFTASLSSNPLIQSIFAAGYPSIAGPLPFNPAVKGTWTTLLTRIKANDSFADTGFGRLDQNVSTKNQAFFTLSYQNETPGVATNSGNLPYLGNGTFETPWHTVLGDTQTFSSFIVNQARFAVQHTPITYPLESPSAAMVASGMNRTQGPNAGQPYSADAGNPNGFPSFVFTASTFASTGQAYNEPQARFNTQFEVADSLLWQRGKHQIKVGFDWENDQDNDVFDRYVRPQVTLNDSSSTPATAYASILAGTVSSQIQNFFLTGSSTRYYRAKDEGFFAEDSWRILPNFELDYGVRYERLPPFTEKNNEQSNAFVMDANDRPEACAPTPWNPSQMNTMAVINPTKFGIGEFCADNNNVAPRVGFTWDTRKNAKTILKSGYGVFFDRIFNNVYENSRFNPPDVVNVTLSGINYTGQVGTAAVDQTTPYSLVTIDPASRTPYTQRFTVGISQELEKNTVLNINYVGAMGTKLLATTEPNLGSSFSGFQFRPTNQGSPVRSLGDIAAGIVRAPFADWQTRTTSGKSNYHGLLVDINHRYSHGVSVQGSYTWSHSKDTISDEISSSSDSAFPQSTDENLLGPLIHANGYSTSSAGLTSAVNAAQGTSLTTNQAAAAFVSTYLLRVPLKTNYGDSDYDVRSRFAASVMYELPFGRDKMFASTLGAAPNKLISGWNVGSIVDAQSGFPFIPTSGTDANYDGDTNDRAVVVGPLQNLKPLQRKVFTGTTRTVNYYAECITLANCPLSQGLGVIDPRAKIARGLLRNPGLANWDFQLNKRTALTERIHMRFSADFFNILNHTNFNPVTASITSTTFGQSLSQRALGQTLSRQIQFGLKFEY
jgi:hypothetical protein